MISEVSNKGTGAPSRRGGWREGSWPKGMRNRKTGKAGVWVRHSDISYIADRGREFESLLQRLLRHYYGMKKGLTVC